MSIMKPDSGRRRGWNNEPLVLFVEGYSDLTFYAELLEHIGHFKKCFIHDLGGKGQLRNAVKVFLTPDKLALISAVGVLLDADNDAAGAFSLAHNALKDAVDVDVPRGAEWVHAINSKVRYRCFHRR